jgi:hypothetical protein
MPTNNHRRFVISLIHAIFTNIFGASVSEAAARPNPRSTTESRYTTRLRSSTSTTSTRCVESSSVRFRAVRNSWAAGLNRSKLYYVDQVGLAVSPASNNFLFLKYAKQPFNICPGPPRGGQPASHRKSVFYGAFVWAHRACNCQKRRPPSPGSLQARAERLTVHRRE